MAIFVQIQLVSHVLTEIVDTPLLNSSLEKRQIPGSIIHLMKKHTSMVPKSTPGAEIKSMASVCLISSCSSFFMVLFRTFRKFLSTFASFLDDMSHQNLPQLIGYSPPTAGVTWGHFPILLLRQSSYDIWRTFLSGPKDCGILWKGLPISFCIPLLELFEAKTCQLYQSSWASKPWCPAKMFNYFTTKANKNPLSQWIG